MKKRILVTGGAGFIGSNFILKMLKEHREEIELLVNLDNLTYAANLENLKEVKHDPLYRFEESDIRNKEELDLLFRYYKFDIVINFAAESHVDNSISNPGIFIETNITGTHNLLEICKKYWYNIVNKTWKDNIKYIQISTDEVYGALGEKGAFTEQSKLAPNSPYSASKTSADLLARAYHKTFGLPMNITRCSNNYGPHQHEEKLIPHMIKKAKNDKKLPVYGDGLQIRDWLHVSDHCEAIYTVLRKGRNGEVYNIGGNNEKTNIEIVKLILDKLNKPKNLISYVEDRLGHDRRYAINNTKITNELGWSPKYTFEQGIIETIEWYKNK